ncbi:MAG: type II toxin-antitoxin system PemK/MazF family toxin [Symploca sp. SIO2C1]|nr:type II toxin-antitoxin system PemK/MazF family toxin [Symploca sp. SIO2C1]
MKRGDVFDARLDPTEGSEQAGNRPVIIVSRNAINAASSVVLSVPCTTYREGRRIYPSQLLIRACCISVEAITELGFKDFSEK